MSSKMSMSVYFEAIYMLYNYYISMTFEKYRKILVNIQRDLCSSIREQVSRFL